MKNKISIIMGAIFLTAISLTIGCGGQEEEQAEEIIRPVRVMQVFSTGGDRVRSFTGNAKSGEESNISFKVAGTIKRIAVRTGQEVSHGTLIAELDKSDYQLKVQQAQAALEQAQAQERSAASNFERVRQLFENNNASRNDYDSARATAESAAAQVASANKQLELARLQLSYTELFSPMSGNVSQVPANENENIVAGNPIVLLIGGTRPQVEVGIPEIFISQIRRGDSATVTFDALPGRSFDATIVKVSVDSSSLSSTYPVSVELEDAESDIRSGMTAEVSFSFASTSVEEKIIVPTASVTQDTEGDHVFIVEPNDDGTATARRRPVEIGEIIGNGIEIISGLSSGELLVTAGVSRIADGQIVNLQQGEEPGK